MRKRMTYKQFLVKLRKTPREWWKFENVAQDRCIRGIKNCCPLTALMPEGPQTASLENTYKAASLLGLSEDIARKIYYAADEDTHYDESVRRDLLEACGLRS